MEWNVFLSTVFYLQTITEYHDGIIRIAMYSIHLETAFLKQSSVYGITVTIEECCIPDILWQRIANLNNSFIDLANVFCCDFTITKAQQ